MPKNYKIQLRKKIAYNVCLYAALLLRKLIVTETSMNESMWAIRACERPTMN